MKSHSVLAPLPRCSTLVGGMGRFVFMMPDLF
jgi:hypothetical protein